MIKLKSKKKIIANMNSQIEAYVFFKITSLNIDNKGFHAQISYTYETVKKEGENEFVIEHNIQDSFSEFSFEEATALQSALGIDSLENYSDFTKTIITAISFYKLDLDKNFGLEGKDWEVVEW